MKEEGQDYSEKVVRILSKDIPGGMTLYSGLTRIKGISWAISNAICIQLKLDKKKRIGELSKEEIDKINEFMKNPGFDSFLKNREKDFDSGTDRHLTGSDLDLRKDFDIKRLKKVKSYRGIRHASGLPMRGQRTRSNFRRNRRKGTGIKKKGGKK